MCRSICARALATSVFVLLSVVKGIASNPDPRLLPLIPPNALLVAGMSEPSGNSQPDNFLLLTRNNSVDLTDFLGLTASTQRAFFIRLSSLQQAVPRREYTACW